MIQVPPETTHFMTALHDQITWLSWLCAQYLLWYSCSCPALWYWNNPCAFRHLPVRHRVDEEMGKLHGCRVFVSPNRICYLKFRGCEGGREWWVPLCGPLNPSNLSFGCGFFDKVSKSLLRSPHTDSSWTLCRAPRIKSRWLWRRWQTMRRPSWRTSSA